MATAPAPPPSFFSRLQTFERSRSYDGNIDIDGEEENEAGPSAPGPDVRRAVSLKVGGAAGPNRIVDSRRDVAALSSFAAAGSTLSPEPPAASRHALFSHHRVVSSTIVPTITAPLDVSPNMASDPGPSIPPSPSSISSGPFSPASAFLNHFSSNASLKHAVPPDGPGARVLSYTLGKVLGRGGFSTVRLATNAKGEEYACKIVKRDDLSDRSGSLEKFEEEIQIWKALPHHKSLLPLIEMDRTDYATFLITPYLRGGDLLDVLRREGGSDRTARKWFPGVVAAVAAMHEGYPGFGGGMLHGDLKLDNFLVDHKGNVMACDFYMAQLLDGAQSGIPPPAPKRRTPSAHRGGIEPAPLPAHFPSASLPYAPPELLQAPPAKAALAQDIWALGCILHALLTGKLPFVDSFDPRLQMKILRNQWIEPDVGREWIECLRGCLDGNKASRWTIEQVKMCDAVVGWKEVKQRSRSRSRQRPAHPPRTPRSEWDADPLTSQPRDHSTTATQSRSRSRAESSSRMGRSRDPPRSASSTRNGGVFRMDSDDLSRSLDGMGIQQPQPRGRSASKPGLHFYRQNDAGVNVHRSPVASSSRLPSATRSGSRTRWDVETSPTRRMHPPGGVAGGSGNAASGSWSGNGHGHGHMSGMGMGTGALGLHPGTSPTNSLSFGFTEAHPHSPLGGSPGRASSGVSTSINMSRTASVDRTDGSRDASRGRGRAGRDWTGQGAGGGEGHLNPDQDGMGNGVAAGTGTGTDSRSRSRTPWDGRQLGVVNEEVGEQRGRRSRSRGRKP